MLLDKRLPIPVFCKYITILKYLIMAKKQNPHDSVIIQAGIVFILVSAIGITAYVFANFYVTGAAAGY